MTPDELRALAGKLRKLQAGEAYEAADYLRACAEAGPVAWRCEVRGDGSDPKLGAVDWRHYHTTTSEREAQAFVSRCDNGIEGRVVPLYAHPAPAAPQAEPKRQAILGAIARAWCHPKNASKEMDVDLADAIVDEVLAINQAEPKREPLTYEQLVSACYTYRHDFGLLDPDEQELVIEEAGRWAKAFGIGGSDE